MQMQLCISCNFSGTGQKVSVVFLSHSHSVSEVLIVYLFISLSMLRNSLRDSYFIAFNRRLHQEVNT